jgi:hypothetical protein
VGRGEEEEVYDHGGWEGGEYVLGGEKKVDGETVRVEGVSRREVLARAAEERRRKMGRGEGEGK